MADTDNNTLTLLVRLERSRQSARECRADEVEITDARWISRDALLGAWEQAGRPQGNGKRVKVERELAGP